MAHILNEEQKEIFLRQMGHLYNNFKAINSWHLTEEMESNYKEGTIDFCDALIYASSQITYDISNLRNEVEELFEKMDNRDE